mgnify:CR=1 FL=1
MYSTSSDQLDVQQHNGTGGRTVAEDDPLAIALDSRRDAAPRSTPTRVQLAPNELWSSVLTTRIRRPARDRNALEHALSVPDRSRDEKVGRRARCSCW